MRPQVVYLSYPPSEMMVHERVMLTPGEPLPDAPVAERVDLMPIATRTGWVCVERGSLYMRSYLGRWSRPEDVPSWMDRRMLARTMAEEAGRVGIPGPYRFVATVDYDSAQLADEAVLTLVPAASVRVIVHDPARMNRSHRG